MFATSLPSLPPPAASLLPVLHDRQNLDSTNPSAGQNSPLTQQQQQQQQQQQRRTRGTLQNIYARSQLAILSNEEQALEQRKHAIQTFGYSWLKPPGCNKTMLGRREEEIEREEVERQLREVELQERNAAEIEEAERTAEQQHQRAQEDRGEIITGEDGDRDLDEDVPDMDAQDNFEDDEDEEEDLDDDIPEADGGYAYDTTRDPDTESEENEFASSSQLHSFPPARSLHRSEHDIEDYERAEQEAIAHQMLDEDELGVGDEDRDLDDDVPDMDDGDQDLDDDIPDADDEEDGGWEHTDTELEESDMDISVMPPGVTTTHRNSMLPPSSSMGRQRRRGHTRQSTASQQSDSGIGLRRSSGNVPLPMAPPSSSVVQHPGRRGLAHSRQAPPHFTPAQIDSDISVSALISTGNTAISSLGDNLASGSQRAWLDPASARRNLFGTNTSAPTQAGDQTRGASAVAPASRTLGSIPNLTRVQGGPTQMNHDMARQVSSGGLFTPSPPQDSYSSTRAFEEPRSRTRSGRLLGAARGSRGAG